MQTMFLRVQHEIVIRALAVLKFRYIPVLLVFAYTFLPEILHAEDDGGALRCFICGCFVMGPPLPFDGLTSHWDPAPEGCQYLVWLGLPVPNLDCYNHTAEFCAPIWVE